MHTQGLFSDRRNLYHFIILIDEYDVPVREKVSESLFQKYLGFLNGLFKNDTLRPAISLAYITGILPVVRDRVQSKLNNFREYTILDARELAESTGFTADEVKSLCNSRGVDYEECRRWYDSYWQHGIEDDAEYRVTDRIVKASKELLRSTWNGNEDAVAKALDVSHIHVTSNRSYNNEDALQSAIYLAYTTTL